MNVCPILVGRASEMDALLSALPKGGVYLVSGESGVGKSRLLRELAEAAEGLGHAAIWGRPEVLSDPGPFSLIIDLLDEAARIPALKSEASEFAAAIGGFAEPPPRQIAARVRGMFSMLNPRPVVMLEDLQDADELSLAVLGHLSRAAIDDGVLIVGTHRTDSTPALERLLDALRRDHLAESMQLRSLGDADLREMLTVMWEREPTEEEVTQISRQAEGVPFFIEELASSGSGSIPGSISRAVGARLGQLEPDTQRVVQVASLVLGAIDPGLIATVSAIDERTVPGHLVAAVRVGLLADREGRLVFRHGLMREAVADTIVSVDRRDLHRRLAEQIQSRETDDVEQHAAALSRHHAEAGEAAEAARWAITAGHRALSVAAIEEARIHFAAAKAAAPTGEINRRAREGLCEVLGRINPRELTEWETLALEYEAEGDRVSAARCWTSRARIESWRQNADMACTFLERARSLLDPGRNQAELARVLVELGLVSPSDRHEEAESRLREGLEVARALGLHEVAARALMGLGWRSASRGQMQLALEFEREGCERALAAGVGRSIVYAFGTHAHTLLLAGRSEEALTSLDEAETWARTHLGGNHALAIEAVRASTYRSLGRAADAELAAARLAASPQANDVGAFARFYALLERDSEEAARSYLSAWWNVLGGAEHRSGCLERPQELIEVSPLSVLACFGEMLVADASDVSTGDWWVAVLESFRRYYADSSPTTRAEMLFAASTAAVRIRRLDAMESLLGDLEEICLVAPYPAHLAMLSRLGGSIHAARNEASLALGCFWESAERYRDLGNGTEASRSARLALDLEEGPAEGRLEFLKELHARVTAAGALCEQAALEEALRRRGIRPRAGRPRGRPRVEAGTLSAREEEVAVLVAAGATNGEIARRLVISERTVEDHVGRAQRRLGLAGRAGLAAWAAKRGLV